MLPAKATTSELPDFYSVNVAMVSPNKLQSEKFLENKFTFYFSSHRKKAFFELEDVLQKKWKILVTGIKDSGKSHFLADYVLRYRFLGKDACARILYINNSELFSSNPKKYLMSELVYELFYDLEDESDSDDFHDLGDPPLIDKDLVTSNKLVRWMHYMHDNFSLVNLNELVTFLAKLKKALNSRGMKVNLIWDESNVMLGPNMIPFDTELFRCMCDKLLFDSVILGVTNNHLNPLKIDSDDYRLEIDAFEVLDAHEMKKLILMDCENFPKDVEDLVAYSNNVFELTEGSIAEYHYYKKAWIWKNLESTVTKQKFVEIQENFIRSREDMIFESESLFQIEKILCLPNLLEYLECLRKVRVYSNFKQITDEDEKVLLYIS